MSPAAAEQLMAVMQQLVVQPGFVLPLDMGSVRQIREQTQWDLPPPDSCPALRERLPANYPKLDSGHESPLRLTKDERKLLLGVNAVLAV